jgi:hypothetical protein
MVIDIEDLTSDAPKAASTTATSSSSTKLSRKPKPPPPSIFSSPSASCTLCEARSAPPESVAEYPRKAVKKAPLEQHVAVSVLRARFTDSSISNSTGEWKYLLIKRPEEGLLAGQWEFPSLILPDATLAAAKGSADRRALLVRVLSVQFCCPPAQVDAALGPLEYVDELTHVFSHRKHLMRVERADVKLEGLEDSVRRDRMLSAANGDAATESSSKPAKKKVKLSASKSKKPKNNESDDDDPASDPDADLVASSSPPTPQSYRWVSLSSLREDHASSGGSELGLTTGQRKIVKMLGGDGKGKGNGMGKKASVSAVKSKKPAASDDAMQIDLADEDTSPVEQEPIELAEEDSGDDVVMVDERKESTPAARSVKKSPAKSKSAPSKPRSSSKKIAAGTTPSKAQPSLLSFFGAK